MKYLKQFLIILAVSFKYGDLKNTENELDSQDGELVKALKGLLRYAMAPCYIMLQQIFLNVKL